MLKLDFIFGPDENEPIPKQSFLEGVGQALNSSSNNAAVQTLGSERADQKIDVVIESREGGDRIALRYSTWTDGLGWCAQKTIRLDGEQLEDLHRAVTVARHRLNRRRAERGESVEAAQVIHLPALA